MPIRSTSEPGQHAGTVRRYSLVAGAVTAGEGELFVSVDKRRDCGCYCRGVGQ